MKRTFLVSLVVFVFAFLTACSKESSTEPKQTASVAGSWKLIEFSMVMGSETETSTEQQLNEEGAVWNLEFTGDKKFEFVTNMRDGTLETFTGTYATSNQQLLMNFLSPAGIPVVSYIYSVTDSQLTLTRSFPSQEGEVNTIAKFRKQQ
jgi:hypothetical protein